MSSNRLVAVILRVMLAGLVVAFGLVLYAQRHGPYLSIEARQYQQIVWDTQSGMSLANLAEKVCWSLGTVFGVVAVALLFFRIRIGTILLLLCAPLLGVAAILGAPPLAFPDIEQTTVVLLTCLASAVWGCVMTYVVMANKMLFSKPTTDSSPPTKASQMSLGART